MMTRIIVAVVLAVTVFFGVVVLIGLWIPEASVEFRYWVEAEKPRLLARCVVIGLLVYLLYWGVGSCVP
ncbi:MAG: hypothetical protein L3K26_02030 [Candidatus Hydrogenedentes bacterium]|nr:hypothetical protein [Candidatus Hydrogenedentota bacterium]